MESNYKSIFDARQYAAECADPVLGEIVLLRALLHAEETFGISSSITGRILLDLIDFYEEQNRHAECAPLYRRVSAILTGAYLEMRL